MTRPVIVLDPHWRSMEELFSDADRATLLADYDVIWGQDGPIPDDMRTLALGRADVLIAADPVVNAATLDDAPNLKAVIEVSGAFPDTVDYDACAARGVEVLSCAPGFRQSVAEMGLGMLLAGARGLVAEHEGFRKGTESWLHDQADRDFTLYGADIGFVGFGQIAQEMMRLLAPFAPRVRAFDPWLPQSVADACGADLTALHGVLMASRAVIVAAVPTRENKALIGQTELSLLPDGALIVLLSRAHLVDFPALMAEVATGRIRAAVDVFPSEPVAADERLRKIPGLILSPHRAAAVRGGRQLIGRMILDDLAALFAGGPERRLTRADPKRIADLAGVGDATAVAAMAETRN